MKRMTAVLFALLTMIYMLSPYVSIVEGTPPARSVEKLVRIEASGNAVAVTDSDQVARAVQEFHEKYKQAVRGYGKTSDYLQGTVQFESTPVTESHTTAPSGTWKVQRPDLTYYSQVNAIHVKNGVETSGTEPGGKITIFPLHHEGSGMAVWGYCLDPFIPVKSSAGYQPSNLTNLESGDPSATLTDEKIRSLRKIVGHSLNCVSLKEFRSITETQVDEAEAVKASQLAVWKTVFDGTEEERSGKKYLKVAKSEQEHLLIPFSAGRVEDEGRIHRAYTKLLALPDLTYESTPEEASLMLLETEIVPIPGLDRVSIDFKVTLKGKNTDGTLVSVTVPDADDYSVEQIEGDTYVISCVYKDSRILNQTVHPKIVLQQSLGSGRR